MIFTFYSFKGGVGRSMALANVAELLLRRGLNVLMVDFDLEAQDLNASSKHGLRPPPMSKSFDRVASSIFWSRTKISKR